MKINCSIEISKSPDSVFPWIAQPEKAMKWQREVVGGEIITNKPEVVGTTFKEVIEEDGKKLEMHGVITQYIENQLIGFHLDSQIHTFDVSYSVVEDGQNSKVTVDANIHWKFPLNIMSLFIGARMKKGMVKQMESELLELKRLCEN